MNEVAVFLGHIDKLQLISLCPPNESDQSRGFISLRIAIFNFKYVPIVEKEAAATEEWNLVLMRKSVNEPGEWGAWKGEIGKFLICTYVVGSARRIIPRERNGCRIVIMSNVVVMAVIIVCVVYSSDTAELALNPFIALLLRLHQQHLPVVSCKESSSSKLDGDNGQQRRNVYQIMQSEIQPRLRVAQFYFVISCSFAFKWMDGWGGPTNSLTAIRRDDSL